MLISTEGHDSSRAAQNMLTPVGKSVRGLGTACGAACSAMAESAKARLAKTHEW